MKVALVKLEHRVGCLVKPIHRSLQQNFFTTSREGMLKTGVVAFLQTQPQQTFSRRVGAARDTWLTNNANGVVF